MSPAVATPDVVAPSLSILAEPAVAVVDKNVDKKGTRAVAQAYLEYLYTEEGQDIAGKNFYRPAVSEKAKAKYIKQFAPIKLFNIDRTSTSDQSGRSGSTR